MIKQKDYFEVYRRAVFTLNDENLISFLGFAFGYLSSMAVLGDYDNETALKGLKNKLRELNQKQKALDNTLKGEI